MNADLKSYFEEAIQYEHLLSSLYSNFGSRFEEDCSFWYKLADEEERHASIINVGYISLLEDELFPEALLMSNLFELIINNKRVTSFINNLSLQNISKEHCYNFALISEFKTIEYLFHSLASKSPENKKERLFQNMLGECKDHIQRIKSIMSNYNFEVNIEREP